MDDRHRKWNEQQKLLRKILGKPSDPVQAIGLFMDQHALVHEGEASGSHQLTFADEVWQGLTDEALRCILPGQDHSIAWLFWHMARIEDVAMNILVAGNQQVLQQGGWQSKLGISFHDTGNLMPPKSVQELSRQIDLPALRGYRLDVCRKTREIVSGLSVQALNKPVLPERIQRIRESGAVVEAAQDLLAYWSGLTIAGLLLMPPTRHCLVHLNEAEKVKPKAMRVTRKGMNFA